MSNILDLYRKDYEFYSTVVDEGGTKYEWAASDIFNLTTYDGALDKLFVKAIIEVCKVILERKTFEYIENKEKYVSYILVCQLLETFNWIEWGTSIRGAWFDDLCGTNYRPRPIVEHPYADYMTPIPFTLENLKTLIEFMEE